MHGLFENTGVFLTLQEMSLLKDPLSEAINIGVINLMATYIPIVKTATLARGEVLLMP